ncbi:MAG: hypothetical protein FWF57_09555 [Defluviitaleaceae bacterium]|nr:hypothetical protein [Defluviitaleaceae bacterium]
MSMPKFPEKSTIFTRDEAINAIITSIAMEEAALGNILNAESEKIKFAIKYIKENNYSPKYLVDINKSVENVVLAANDMQIILKNKLDIAIREKEDNKKPDEKPYKPNKPYNKKQDFQNIDIPQHKTENSLEVPKYLENNKTAFVSYSKCWRKGNYIKLKKYSEDINEKINLNNGLIFLPKNTEYIINFDIHILNPLEGDIEVNFFFSSGKRKQYKFFYPIFLEGKYFIKEEIKINAQDEDSFISLLLESPNDVKLEYGKISILFLHKNS